MTGPVVFGLAVGLFAGPHILRAGEGSLPEAAAILDKYVEATGGKAAHQKIHNRVIRERMADTEMGLEDLVVVYQAEPNLRFVEITSEAFGTIKHGTDGHVVWYLSSPTGPLLEEGDARAGRLRGAVLHGALHWRKLYRNAECVGEEVVEGKKCYKVVMTDNEGGSETRYYDKDSGLLVQAKTTRLSSFMPPVPMELTYSDYKPVDGILIAHKRKQKFEQCGNKHEMLFVTKRIEHNVELPADRFDPPEEVQAVALTKAAADSAKKLLPTKDAKEAAQAPCGQGKATASSEKAKEPKQARPPCGGG